MLQSVNVVKNPCDHPTLCLVGWFIPVAPTFSIGHL
jgi:hypothetical protein